MSAGILLVVVGIVILVMSIRRDVPNSIVVAGCAVCAVCVMAGVALIAHGV